MRNCLRGFACLLVIGINGVSSETLAAKTSTSTLRGIAEKEIEVSAGTSGRWQSKGPATIEAVLPRGADERILSSFEAGITLSPYRHRGFVEIPGLEPYDSSDLPVSPMVGIHFDWFFLRIPDLTRSVNLKSGLIGSFQYSGISVKPGTSSGKSLDDVRLHTLITMIGLGFDFVIGRRELFRPGINLCVGRLSSVHGSALSIANYSESANIFSIGPSLKLRLFNRISAFTSYEYRAVFGSRGSNQMGIQNHNFLIGLFGDLR